MHGANSLDAQYVGAQYLGTWAPIFGYPCFAPLRMAFLRQIKFVSTRCIIRSWGLRGAPDVSRSKQPPAC